MRFRGIMTEATPMRDFMHICFGISKLSKECTLRVTKNKVYFIISGDETGPKKPFVWCEMHVNFYFTQFALVGESDDINEMFLSFDAAMLTKSLTTLKHNAKSLKLKLTDKQFPCLTIEIEQLSGQNISSRHCIHDIPVNVIPREQWSDYEEPHFDDFHVSIQMPNLKSVKNIVERMKNLNSTLIMSANKNGTFSLKIKINLVTLSANFPNLSVQSFFVGSNVGSVGTFLPDDDDEDDADTVSVAIDAKKFLMFASGMHITNCKTVCSIVQGQMVKLHIEQPGALSLQCFLTETST